jgi:cytochrome c biogenesis protein CcmG/thiol:disulfide interchange protein DsbE
MRAMASRRSLLLVPLLLAAACTQAPAQGPSPADQGAPASNATTAPLLPTSVASLPRFGVDTYERLLTQLRGTPVVVNIWASWCGPCKAESPLLREASRNYGDRVQFLGVDILDTLGGARTFLADEHITYPSVFDPPAAIRDALGMIGQPATVFYDANGTVVSSWDGQLTATALQEGIDAALG